MLLLLIDLKDSKPRYRICPSPPSKVHQIRYLSLGEGTESTYDVLTLSTEDGRVIFYDTTAAADLDSTKPTLAAQSVTPLCRAVGQLGGTATGIAGRIKDFEILKLGSKESHGNLLVVTASSDGAIRLWAIEREEMSLTRHHAKDTLGDVNNKRRDSKSNDTGTINFGLNNIGPPQIGRLLDIYETGNRITCLKAFIMAGQPGSHSSEAGE